MKGRYVLLYLILATIIFYVAMYYPKLLMYPVYLILGIIAIGLAFIIVGGTVFVFCYKKEIPPCYDDEYWNFNDMQHNLKEHFQLFFLPLFYIAWLIHIIIKLADKYLDV